MTRDEIEEMIRHSIDDAAIHRKFDAGVEQAASDIYDKLVLAGVIPAEGDVIVKENAWDRFLFAVEAVAPCQRRINRREAQRESDRR